MGGIINQEVLDAANFSARGAFDEVFLNPGMRLFETFTEVIPTDSKINEIDILETMPVMRRWLGEKEFAAIRASYLRATIEKWERSIEMDRLDFKADKIGLIAKRLAAFASATGRDYDKIAFEALIANGTGYDGVALISASHPRGPSGATQSNTSTTAIDAAQLEAVLVAGASLRDENGETLGVSYDTIMVGPSKARLLRELTQSTERLVGMAGTGALDSGTRVTANVIANKLGMEVYTGGSLTLVINPRLVGTYVNYYYAFDTSIGPKPLHLFEMRAPELIEQTNMDAEARFLLDKLRWSVEADLVVAPGAWQAVFGGLVTA